MLPRRILDTTLTDEGSKLELFQRGEEFFIHIDRWELMQSRSHQSEKELARLALEAIGPRRGSRWLVGGLGMGFTLRACLEALDSCPGGSVLVAEVFDAVVKWNRGPLGHLADHPLRDSRAKVRVVDIYRHLVEESETYDAILLDIDNGPEAFTLESNGRLYESRGLALLDRRLKKDGVLAIWSAGREARFEALLKRSGFRVDVRQVRARQGRGARYTIYLARPRG